MSALYQNLLEGQSNWKIDNKCSNKISFKIKRQTLWSVSDTDCFIFAVIIILFKFKEFIFSYLHITKEMPNLRINVASFLATENRGNAVHIAVVKSGDEDGVEAIQMSSKVPKTSFSCETAVHQHVETIDAEERRVALASGKYVQSGMAEADIADNIAGFQQAFERRRLQERRQIIDKVADGCATSSHSIVWVNTNL